MAPAEGVEWLAGKNAELEGEIKRLKLAAAAAKKNGLGK